MAGRQLTELRGAPVFDSIGAGDEVESEQESRNSLELSALQEKESVMCVACSGYEMDDKTA